MSSIKSASQTAVLSVAAGIVMMAALVVFTMARPLAAYADGENPLHLAVPNELIDVRDSPAPASKSLKLGQRVVGEVRVGHEEQYTFTTTGGHSAYRIQLECLVADNSVSCNVYDADGDFKVLLSTTLKSAKSVFLPAGTSCSLKVFSAKECSYAVQVTEVPSLPTYQASGNNRSNPVKLELGKAVNSQFDDISGTQSQWFTFKTTGKHSAYGITLDSKMSGQRVSYSLYDPSGNFVTSGSTDARATGNVLLATNTTYTVKTSASYTAQDGYPSYQLNVRESTSKPQYKARGNNRNSPYKLTLGKKVASQFDDMDGNQDQWFSFKTSSSKMPYRIASTCKTANAFISWGIYDESGSLVAYNSLGTKLVKTVKLNKKKTYYVKVSGSYTADTGYTAYQLKVNQLKLGKVKSVKMKASGRTLAIKYAKAANATAYQVAYKKAGTKAKWRYRIVSGTSCKIAWMKANTKYQAKVRPAYYLGGQYFYGKWTSKVSATTK